VRSVAAHAGRARIAGTWSDVVLRRIGALKLSVRKAHRRAQAHGA
jgi:hypothetical protein